MGPMLRFGGGVTVANVLAYVSRNADNLIVGYSMGSSALGIYSKAYNLLLMPVRQFSSPLSNVLLPALSRLQDDPARYRAAYVRAIGVLALVTMPFVCFLFVAADEAVLLVLGPKWESAADVFRWLAPAALVGSLQSAPYSLCRSLGKAKTQVLWALISTPMTVLGMAIGSNWGINGVAASISLTSVPLFLLFLAMGCHNSPVSISCVLRLLFPVLASCIGATILSSLVAQRIGIGGWNALLGLAAHCAVFWPTFLLLLCLSKAGRKLVSLTATDAAAAIVGWVRSRAADMNGSEE